MPSREQLIMKFEYQSLDDRHTFLTGVLPVEQRFDASAFESLWRLHPIAYHEIVMGGRKVLTPRWQQAFGLDYRYSGRINRALPIPPLLQPLLSWASNNIDARLNAILVNWYDGARGHYMGRHRDTMNKLLKDAPIVTISFGEERIFRLRPRGGTGHTDFVSRDGAVFVMPYETNREWTHEIPRLKKYLGRRVSVTLRGFMT
jgi:alkylated DNA repair dioxygenase AlkB